MVMKAWSASPCVYSYRAISIPACTRRIDGGMVLCTCAKSDLVVMYRDCWVSGFAKPPIVVLPAPSWGRWFFSLRSRTKESRVTRCMLRSNTEKSADGIAPRATRLLWKRVLETMGMYRWRPWK